MTALLKRGAIVIVSVVLLVSLAQAQEVCPHRPGWKPTPEELKAILSDHQQWVERWEAAKYSRERAAQNTQGMANLCHADLSGAKLNEANLRGAELNKANLSGAELNKADLSVAKLNKANLSVAKLNKANLSVAELKEANLFGAELNKANLSLAELNKANLSVAKLNEAKLILAELNEADLSGAELNKADLFGAKLNEADLSGAELNEANLSRAELNEANLGGTQIKDTFLAYANLTNAFYAPASPPPSSYVAGIAGLETLRFSKGHEVGLVQLRELLQKAGLREAERQATFSIEAGKTKHLLENWRINPGEGIEGLFRRVAFEWTTDYGLSYGRSLELLLICWLVLIPVYWWTIWHNPGRSASFPGIYRTWPKDRIEKDIWGDPKMEATARVERLRARVWAALGWSAWFSLLSAFHIGFREFSVGTWLSRVHPRQFTLEPTGWVRTVSGLQSLLSLYLLAMWVLTYFGRPFQ